jgi:hypothetical protein
MRAPDARGRVAISAGVALLLCTACGQDSYRPIYYPNGADLTKYTRGPFCTNAAQARQWAKDQAEQRRDPDWTYEIGKNCKPYGDTDIEICAETFK